MGAWCPACSRVVEHLDVRGGDAATVSLDAQHYRALARRAAGVGGQARRPCPSVGARGRGDRERTRNVALAALATLLTLVLLAEALVPIIRRRVRAQIASDEEESIELLGSALAAATDRDTLLPVILETVVEATGAVGGVLVEGGQEIAVIGERPPLADPLRLELAAENGSEAIALLYPPFGGFSAVERRRAERLAAQASVAVENARQHAITKLEAITDPLTGLPNRRRFMEQLTVEAHRRSRSGRPVALIMADLDDFKRVNDLHGHDAGDDVLRAFAGVLRGAVRDIDTPARLGGEEFAVLLPETGGDGARMLAGRLRERLERLQIDGPAHRHVHVTASFGVASCPPAERVEDLPGEADEALYEAKHQGKNRVVEAVPR